MENSTERCAQCGEYIATLLLPSDPLDENPGPKLLCERCGTVRGDLERCEFRHFETQNSSFARIDAGYLLGAHRWLRPSERTIYETAVVLGDGNRRPISQRQLAAFAEVSRSTTQLALTRLAWIGLVCLLPKTRGTRILIVRERGTSSKYGLRGSVVKPGVYAAAEQLAALYAVLELCHWTKGAPARRSTVQTSGPLHRSTSDRATGPMDRSRVDRPERSTHPYQDQDPKSDPSIQGSVSMEGGPTAPPGGTDGGGDRSWTWPEYRKRHPAGSWFQWLHHEPKSRGMLSKIRSIFRGERTESGKPGPIYDDAQIMDGLKALSGRMATLGHGKRSPRDVLTYLEAQAVELVKDPPNGAANPLMCACKRETRIDEWFTANEARAA